MKFNRIVNIILSLFIGLQLGCNSFIHQPKEIFSRNPAADINSDERREAFLKVLQFKSSDEVVAESDIQTTMVSQLWDKYRINSVFHLDTNLPPDVSYGLEFQMKEGKTEIIIHHAENAFNNVKSSKELLEFFMQFKGATGVFRSSKNAIFEMYYNASKGDSIAIYNFARMRQKVAKKILELDSSDNYLSKNANEWNESVKKYEAMEKAELKKQKELEDLRKLSLDALDSASDEHQFKNLVAKNDRNGVVDLLKKYLPWEQMPPFEKKYWETYIEVVLNPLPIEERIMLFRGLGDDNLQAPLIDGVELAKPKAEKEGNVFVLSPVLSKNQGSWNRRLRSLTSMYDKYIAADFDRRKRELDNSYTRSARIMTMMTNHSGTPKGSPFLSFTHSFHVAEAFAGGKIGVFVIDPRLLSYNIASISLANNPKDMADELETLIPLAVFPDDVGYVAIEGVNTEFLDEFELMKSFKEKLKLKYGGNQAEIILSRLKGNTEVFKKGVEDFKGRALIKTPLETRAPSRASALKTHFTTPAPIHSCVDVMRKFWN